MDINTKNKVTDINIFEKRLEILLGSKLEDDSKKHEAADSQDALRKKYVTLRKPPTSTELIRLWRDTRWSS